MIYVMSDIHGCYEKYIAMIEKIQLEKTDRLYILGDVIDRGPDGIKIILDMMRRGNVIPMLGNHEYMAYTVLERLNVDITEENCETQMDYKTMRNWKDWMENGGAPTQEQFVTLNRAKRKAVLNYIEEFDVYNEISVGGKTFILVHGGLGNFSPDKLSGEYALHELVWERPDYYKTYFEDKYLITGHTPTVLIDEKYCGKIYKGNNHIAIDCGAAFGMSLGCICLDTMEEFYV